MTPAWQKSETQPGGAGSQSAREDEASKPKHTVPHVELEQTRRFLRTLDPSATSWHFRTFPDVGDGPGRNYYGTLDDLAVQLQLDNGNGRGVFVVINEGGQKASEITRVRSVFADFDSPKALHHLQANPSSLQVAGRDPHLIVQSSDGKLHVYWRADGLSVEQFRAVQDSIIARYGSDAQVRDPSRVMRLPGFVHQKPENTQKGHNGKPFLTRVALCRPDSPFAADEILAAFPPASRASPAAAPTVPVELGAMFSPDAQFAVQHYPDAGKAVWEGRHADMRDRAAVLARKVVFEGWGRSAALVCLKAMRDEGAWPGREMPDAEIERALDDAIEKCRSGEWRDAALPAAANDPIGPSLAQLLAAEIRPITDAEFEEARKPHPHVFMRGEEGLFPVGEVTVVAAPGREGKTFSMVYLSAQAVLGGAVAGLAAEPQGVLIYSNEDSRKQYVKKIGALRSRMPEADKRRLQNALMVPDLEVPGLVEAREIVAISEKRRPVPTAMVDTLIEVLRPLTTKPDRIGMVLFETASTLSDADEDNPGLKTLVAALKRIARELEIAVVLVHHTSQAATENLPSLNLSTNDIRGGTALTANSRQCFLLVNSGSVNDPLPAKDLRTHMRNYVAPFAPDRVTVLVCLNTSKAIDPPPVFLAWGDSEFGAALSEIKPPVEVEGMRWRRMRQAVVAWASEKREEAKGEQQATDIAACIEMAAKLQDEGKPPTVRAVSIALNHGADWAQPRLEVAVARGLMIRTREHVPKTKGETDVYRVVRKDQSSEADE